MNRRKLIGFLGAIPFLTLAKTQAEPIQNKPSNDSVEFDYIGVFEWGGDGQCLAEIMINKKCIHRPDVIAMACTRLMQECYFDKIEVKHPRFRFSKTSFLKAGVA